MRLTSENLQTTINPELATNFEKLIETLQTAIRCFKSQPIGNLYRTIHCKFFENTLIDLHLIGKNKIFDAYIDQAKSCGLDVSRLQDALQMLKNLCDDSIESNKKIEDIDAYIQKNVIQVVENFCASAFPANKKQPVENSLVIANQQPDRQMAFGPHTFPKELIALILSFLEPIDTPLYPKGMASLSLTCKIWQGHLIENLKNKHLELDMLMKKAVAPLVRSITYNYYQRPHQFTDHIHIALMKCLAETSYKEYFIEYLATKEMGGFGFAIDCVMKTQKELIDVLNISPESWNFLSERKKHLYVDEHSSEYSMADWDVSYKFMKKLIKHLELPKSKKQWKLFNQLIEDGFFNRLRMFDLWYLPEDRCNFFLEELKEALAFSESLMGLELCAEKCRIPILHAIGAEQLWRFLRKTDGEYLFKAIDELHGEVALELIRILDYIFTCKLQIRKTTSKVSLEKSLVPFLTCTNLINTYYK